MPKRSDTSETLTLALEIFKRIPRPGTITAAELHAQLAEAGHARDLRTIQRLLDMMSRQFDVDRDETEKPYRYSWKSHAKGIAAPNLTRQESLLLMLAHEHLKGLLPASLVKSMESFFNQASANLDDPVRAKLEREWLSKVRVVSTTQPLLPPKVRPGVFEEVSNALYANKWLEVDYTNAAGGRKTADIMPLGLAQQGPRMYLVCRYKNFDNERSLALHRITSATMSPHEFQRPAGFSLQKYDDDGRFGIGDGQRIKLTLRIDKDAGLHLLESPLSTDQTHKDLGDEYEITATVVETSQLNRWIRSFGDQITKVRRVKVNPASPAAATLAAPKPSRAGRRT